MYIRIKSMPWFCTLRSQQNIYQYLLIKLLVVGAINAVTCSACWYVQSGGAVVIYVYVNRYL